jgi:hypothetical protein
MYSSFEPTTLYGYDIVSEMENNHKLKLTKTSSVIASHERSHSHESRRPAGGRRQSLTYGTLPAVLVPSAPLSISSPSPSLSSQTVRRAISLQSTIESQNRPKSESFAVKQSRHSLSDKHLKLSADASPKRGNTLSAFPTSNVNESRVSSAAESNRIPFEQAHSRSNVDAVDAVADTKSLREMKGISDGENSISQGTISSFKSK